MKLTLTLIFLTIAACSFGQAKFKDVEAYGEWMMHYYEKPEPSILFDAFNYGVHSKKIAKSGNRTMITGFFSSCLRNDTVQQQIFYDKISKTKDDDLIAGFNITLWRTQTKFSLELLAQFSKQENQKKYKSLFDELMTYKHVDLWADSITNPEHLDMLWTDFFATGNEKSVQKIITKLSDLNSTDPLDLATAGSAQWSLASNSIQHERVLEICTKQIENSSGRIKESLEQIVATAIENRKTKN